MLRNQKAASSTVEPTVKSPWFWWIRLAARELGLELLAVLDAELHPAALCGDDHVVLVEHAGVLGDRRERDPERAERLSVHAVAVCGGDDVGTRMVHGGVDDERGAIDRA